MIAHSSETKQFCETSSKGESSQVQNNETARLPQVLKLTTSKAKKFCETSFKNGRLSAELTASCQFVLRGFRSMCLKYRACHENGRSSQVIRSAAPVTPNHLSKPTDLIVQNATRLKRSAPWPHTMSDSCVSCTAPATRIASFQIIFKRPKPAIVFETAAKPTHVWLTLDKLHNPWRLPHQTANVQKWPEHDVVLWKFWLGNLLRATTACTFETCQSAWRMVVCFVHLTSAFLLRATMASIFFYISTSKCAPRLRCFSPFDLEMRFVRQQRSLFEHFNFQKLSETEVFSACWLQNLLRATAACNLLSHICPDGSAPAASASLLFDPPQP